GFDKDLVVVKPGINNCASEGMEIIFDGVPAHASQPEHGKNPSLAVCNIVQAIPELIAPEKWEGLVLCTVVQIDVGERAFGCAAAKGKLLMTLRAQNGPELEKLQQILEDMAIEQAKEYELGVGFIYHDVFPETRSWPECVDKVKAACDAIGQPWFERSDFQRGSEDFGHFMKNTPGAYFIVGNGKDTPAIHTVKFDFPDSHIKLVANVFGQLAGIRK
ncbi:MAG: peptidase dimerization domain-containing protein, partial [Firmicutes bacterium]|nr:peptidase dimerization domain-containing protein [Bacillota bacterium]